MHWRRSLIAAVSWVSSIVAQTPSPELSARLRAIRYPPLAELARVQGDVRVHLESGEAAVVSGPPLLRATAIESAKTVASLGALNGDLIYHFLIDGEIETVQVSRIVPIGDAFDRAVLRLFHLKPYKIVTEFECHGREPVPSDFGADGATIEIWVHGRNRCIQTMTGELMASR